MKIIFILLTTKTIFIFKLLNVKRTKVWHPDLNLNELVVNYREKNYALFFFKDKFKVTLCVTFLSNKILM